MNDKFHGWYEIVLAIALLTVVIQIRDNMWLAIFGCLAVGTLLREGHDWIRGRNQYKRLTNLKGEE